MYGIFAGDLKVAECGSALEAMKTVAKTKPIVKFEAYADEGGLVGVFETRTDARRAVRWGKDGSTRKVKVRHRIQKVEAV